MIAAFLPALLLFGGCASGGRPVALPAQSRYVAMGSSFAAGPGITTSADLPATRCTRSADNYAHQLARRRNLTLVDVSCGGATSAHLLCAWRELPPQIDALTADTRLVTVTIGGNDLGYVGGLMAASCPAADRTCRPFPTPEEATWKALETRLDAFADAVKQRAPDARLVFVNYVTLLPRHGGCAALPLAVTAADAARVLSDRLARLTAAVARRHGAEVLDAVTLSRDHHVCATEPWSNGAGRAGASLA